MADKAKNKITLAHGSGGRPMHELVKRLRKRFSNPALDELSDAAQLHVKGCHLAFSTDSYVIKPLFFPGGDIGKLCVFGTVNDISMKGARPLYISLSFIIEEGLDTAVFERVIESIDAAAREARVSVVTGDIKVVEKGAADRLFINTSGIGVIIDPRGHIGSKARPGDIIIINGPIAEHGMAIFNARNNFGFSPSIKSDCTNLNFVVEKCLKAGRGISVMRDLTRGGLATSLNEISEASGLAIEIYEEKIPIRPSVKKMCDILGFDPLYIANEGKFVCFVKPESARHVARAMGPFASVIGRVTSARRKEVTISMASGSSRLLLPLDADQLPRIC